MVRPMIFVGALLNSITRDRMCKQGSATLSRTPCSLSATGRSVTTEEKGATFGVRIFMGDSPTRAVTLISQQTQALLSPANL